VAKKKKPTGSKKSTGVDFGKYLRGLNRHLDKAKETAAEGGFEEYSDGRYAMRATDAKLALSKKKNAQVVLTWKFLDGDYKGKEKLDFEGLNEDHLPYLLRKLDAMGYDTAELEDLESDLKTILDDIKKTKPKLKVRIKTKGEFQNLYVDGPLDDEEEEEDDEDDEDEPKKKKSKKKSKKTDDDEDDEEDEEEDGDDESDDDEEESDDDEEDEEEDDDEEEKPKKKKKGKKNAEEDDEEEDDEEDDEEVDDEVDVVVGSIVKAESKKLGKVKGEVIELFEAEGKVLIKTDKGKTLKLKADQILSVEESPAESVPKKKKKSKK